MTCRDSAYGLSFRFNSRSRPPAVFLLIRAVVLSPAPARQHAFHSDTGTISGIRYLSRNRFRNGTERDEDSRNDGFFIFPSEENLHILRLSAISPPSWWFIVMHKCHETKNIEHMILYPMVISAIAVLATLVYASYRDIRERRVPFRTWYPMLAVGILATIWLLYDTTGNTSLIAGYLGLVASFLYANYLDSREETDPFNFYYLGIVLVIPAFAWFILPKTVNLSLVPWYGMFVGVLAYVSYEHYRMTKKETTRKKRKHSQANINETLDRWYFVLILIIFAIASFFMIFGGGWGLSGLYVALAAVFCGVFYIFGRMHLFGGADAWALIFVAFCIPTFPITPLLGVPPIGFLAFSVLINALIVNLVAPVGIFIINIARGNRAPLQYMFFGFPVKGDTIQDAWGFVMEEFDNKEGTVTRRFIGFRDTLSRMYSGEGRMYTKDLREHPEAYTTELAMYKKAGMVWISYAVPFIVPITAGLVTAIFFGDFLFGIMNLIVGG
ncbi:MAG: A24 family peptidase C-terminal domain-containing protein [Methanoregula sp.]